jgi:hypothetical protein
MSEFIHEEYSFPFSLPLFGRRNLVQTYLLGSKVVYMSRDVNINAKYGSASVIILNYGTLA